MNAHDQKCLALILDEYAPNCECNMPEPGEDGIIYCLACRLRDFFDIQPAANHARRMKATQDGAA